MKGMALFFFIVELMELLLTSVLFTGRWEEITVNTCSLPMEQFLPLQGTSSLPGKDSSPQQPGVPPSMRTPGSTPSLWFFKNSVDGFCMGWPWTLPSWGGRKATWNRGKGTHSEHSQLQVSLWESLMGIFLPKEFFQRMPSVFSHIDHSLLGSSFNSSDRLRILCHDCPGCRCKCLLNCSSELLTNTLQAGFHSKPVSENYD